MASTLSYAVLNAVPKERLGQMLVHVLDKMAVNDAKMFSDKETTQLETMLMLSGAQIDAIIHVAKELFYDAATFGQVDRNLLISRGVDADVVHAVEKVWRKRGRSLAAQIKASPRATAPAITLRKTDWRLHLEMGSSKRSGQSQPTAIFQLDLAGMSANDTGKLDVELSHAELRSLFLQLNAIQAELDTSSP